METEQNGKNNERRCIISREAGEKDSLIRFAADPQGRLIADIKGNLPGRGAWVSCSRSAVEAAVKRKAFARALKISVEVPDNLAEDVDKLLARAALANLSLARRGGAVITGAGKVESAIRAKPAAVAFVLHAAEAAADGRRKLAQAVYAAEKAASAGKKAKAEQKGIKILSPFTAEELQFAFGEHNVMHIAVCKDRGAAGFIKAINRLMTYRGSPEPQSGEAAELSAGQEKQMETAAKRSSAKK